MEIVIAILAVLVLIFLILMFPREEIYGRQARRKIKCLAGAALEKKR